MRVYAGVGMGTGMAAHSAGERLEEEAQGGDVESPEQEGAGDAEAGENEVGHLQLRSIVENNWSMIMDH